ncbi:MAG TPA: hypothetical protein VGR49_04010 [Actinomycetota bacterium]|nr:hypothetical protein [Actinomycetota bacterium]
MERVQLPDPGSLAARISLVLAVVAAVAVLFLPVGRSSTIRSVAPGEPPPQEVVRSTNLLAEEGPEVVALAAFPVVLAAIPIVGERFRPGSRGLRILSAVFLWLFLIVGLASIGWFYLPSAIAMTFAAVARLRRAPEAGSP